MRLKTHHARTALQFSIFLCGCVPVVAGGSGAMSGISAFSDQTFDISVDSHVRYLSGLLLAIGLLSWSLIPRIETKTVEFRLLTCIVFVGGLARLGALIPLGWPSPAMVFGLCMELVVMPLLCVWQGRIHKATQAIYVP